MTARNTTTQSLRIVPNVREPPYGAAAGDGMNERSTCQADDGGMVTRIACDECGAFLLEHVEGAVGLASVCWRRYCPHCDADVFTQPAQPGLDEMAGVSA